MEMRMEMADGEERLDFFEEAWWTKLPDDLQKEALAWLPVDSVLKYRSVSMEWNSLLSSRKFLSGVWAKTPINKKPRLLLWQQGSTQPCHAFCFYTGTWKASFSLSFLHREGEVLSGGSAEGRLMVLMQDPLSQFSISVSNPYTQTSFKLPPLTSIERDLVSVILKGEDGGDIYKVVVKGRRSDSNVSIVEIYDSSVKTWRIAGHIPGDLNAMNQMIFCDGYFYCLIFHQMNQMERRRRIPMILIFSIQDAREMRFWVQPMPEDNGRRMYCLITCGSRLLMVSAKIEPNGLVIIWEFHKSPSDSSWRWEEIARMPEFLRDLLNWSESAVEGVGDCVCFISGRGTSVVVLVYNLNKKSWKWLPDTPLYFDTTHTKCMPFEPRPAINIE